MHNIFTMKYIYTTFFVFAIVLIPSAVSSATTTSADSVVGLQTEVQEAMETDMVDHPRISIKNGLARRISQSPAGLANINLSYDQVMNSELLELYARKLVLSEPIKSLRIDERDMDLTVRGKARMFGFIPSRLSYDVSIVFDGRTPEITVDYPTRWSRLMSKSSTESVTNYVLSDLEGAQYISLTQLKAHTLQAIITNITS